MKSRKKTLWNLFLFMVVLTANLMIYDLPSKAVGMDSAIKNSEAAEEKEVLQKEDPSEEEISDPKIPQKSIKPKKVVIQSKRSKGNKFTISWLPVEGATEYRIYRRAKSEPEMTMIDVTKNTKYSDTTMENGKRYYYRVSAYNGVKEGKKSHYVSVLRLQKIECKRRIVMEVGTKKRLSIKLIPKKPTNPALKITSSDKKIASVSQKGLIKAKKKGTVVITIKSMTGVTAKCRVKVKEKSRIVALDAGHQLHGNPALEPVAPGSLVMKAKVSSGTSGVVTGVPEYQLNLNVTLKLEKELKNRGYKVVMIRRTNDVNLSNSERAQIANRSGAEIFVRIHANGGASSQRGILTMSPTASNPYIGSKFRECDDLSKALVNHMCLRTGAPNKGVIYTDSMSGINWSAIPVSIVEMGFMTNPEEDRLMQNVSYQKKLVQGMADGIDEYFRMHK